MEIDRGRSSDGETRTRTGGTSIFRRGERLRLQDKKPCKSRNTPKRTSRSSSRGATRSSPYAAAGSPRAQNSITAPAARRHRPRPGAPACATSPGASPDPPRYARSVARSPTRDERRAAINSSGYFFGRGIGSGGSPLARTSSWPQGLRRTRDGSVRPTRKARASTRQATNRQHEPPIARRNTNGRTERAAPKKPNSTHH